MLVSELDNGISLGKVWEKIVSKRPKEIIKINVFILRYLSEKIYQI